MQFEVCLCEWSVFLRSNDQLLGSIEGAARIHSRGHEHLHLLLKRCRPTNGVRAHFTPRLTRGGEKEQISRWCRTESTAGHICWRNTSPRMHPVQWALLLWEWNNWPPAILQTVGVDTDTVGVFGWRPSRWIAPSPGNNTSPKIDVSEIHLARDSFAWAQTKEALQSWTRAPGSCAFTTIAFSPFSAAGRYGHDLPIRLSEEPSLMRLLVACKDDAVVELYRLKPGERHVASNAINRIECGTSRYCTDL